jgi:hypothetical protein
MALEFQERADGFRVVRDGGGDHMIASVRTKRMLPAGNKEWREALEAHVTKMKLPPDEHERKHAEMTNNGATLYVPLPRGQYTIHGPGGPMLLTDLEEILARLK